MAAAKVFPVRELWGRAVRDANGRTEGRVIGHIVSESDDVVLIVSRGFVRRHSARVRLDRLELVDDGSLIRCATPNLHVLRPTQHQ